MKALCRPILFMTLLTPVFFSLSCQKRSDRASEAAASEERPPIIDVHVHAYPAWDSKSGDPSLFPESLTFARSDEELLEEILQNFERFNIVKAVAFGGRLESLQKAAPGRIIPGYQRHVGNETKPEDLTWLRRGFASGRYAMLAELWVQPSGAAPNDAHVEPYFKMAEELDVPIGIHMGPAAAAPVNAYWPQYRVALGNPLLLEDTLIRHPRLRVYVMHAGWPFLEEMIGLMFAHPRVYVDVSLINWLLPREEFHRYLRGLVEAGLGKRIMFGSDQTVWLGVIASAIEGIESADFLTAEQKRDIFYHNAVRFLRVEAGSADH